MNRKKEECDFNLVLKGKWKGQIPNEELIEILKIVQDAFKESVKSVSEKIKKEDYPELVFSFFGEGSTIPGWNVIEKTQPDASVFIEEPYGKAAKRKLAEGIEAIHTPHLISESNRSIVDIILPLQDVVKENNGFNSIVWEFRDGDKPVKPIEFDNEVFKSIEIRVQEIEEQEKAIMKSFAEPKPMVLLGVLREVNTYDKEEKCQIDAPFLKRKIKCRYPEEMEAEVCEFLMPPRPNIVASGKMHYKTKTGDYDFFEIESIRRAQTLFDEEAIDEGATNLDKYIGSMKALHSSKKADEITEWMIETLWD